MKKAIENLYTPSPPMWMTLNNGDNDDDFNHSVSAHIHSITLYLKEYFSMLQSILFTMDMSFAVR